MILPNSIPFAMSAPKRQENAWWNNGFLVIINSYTLSPSFSHHTLGRLNVCRQSCTRLHMTLYTVSCQGMQVLHQNDSHMTPTLFNQGIDNVVSIPCMVLGPGRGVPNVACRF